MQVEVSMKDKKKAERRYQEYLKKMNKKRQRNFIVYHFKTTKNFRKIYQAIFEKFCRQKKGKKKERNKEKTLQSL